MHDDTQPTRVWEMTEALREGQFPVRLVKDLGYGFSYPIFNFYSPLPYYIGAFFVLLGVPILLATKLMFIVGILLAPLCMFLLGKRIFGTVIASVVAVIYMYAPYHAVQIYVRGSVGEYFAYGFLPLVFYGILMGQRSLWKGAVIGGLGFSALILSHNITALILVFGLLGWLVIDSLKKSIWKQSVWYGRAIISVVIGGLAVSTFFWLPALFESSYTKVQSLAQGSNDFRLHFVYLSQLWDSPWGYAGSAPGLSDGMSFKIGKIPLLISAVGILIFMVQLLRSQTKFSYRILGSSFGFLISIFALLPISEIIWKFIPFANFLQYPWRILVFVSFFLALLVGSLLSRISKKYEIPQLLISLILGIAILIVQLKYFQPQFIRLNTASDYTSTEAMRWNISQISDEYLPKNFPIPENIEQIAKDDFTVTDGIIIESSEVKAHRLHLSFTSLKAGEIVFFRAFFPGWRFALDGKNVSAEIRDGLPVVSLQQGNHRLTAYFEDTWVRKIGNVISVLTLMGMSTIVYIKLKKNL